MSLSECEGVPRFPSPHEHGDPFALPRLAKGFPLKVQKQSACQHPSQPRAVWWPVAKGGEKYNAGDVSTPSTFCSTQATIVAILHLYLRGRDHSRCDPFTQLVLHPHQQPQHSDCYPHPAGNLRILPCCSVEVPGWCICPGILHRRQHDYTRRDFDALRITVPKKKSPKRESGLTPKALVTLFTQALELPAYLAAI